MIQKRIDQLRLEIHAELKKKKVDRNQALITANREAIARLKGWAKEMQ